MWVGELLPPQKAGTAEAAWSEAEAHSCAASLVQVGGCRTRAAAFTPAGSSIRSFLRCFALRGFIAKTRLPGEAEPLLGSGASPAGMAPPQEAGGWLITFPCWGCFRDKVGICRGESLVSACLLPQGLDSAAGCQGGSRELYIGYTDCVVSRQAAQCPSPSSPPST